MAEFSQNLCQKHCLVQIDLVFLVYILVFHERSEQERSGIMATIVKGLLFLFVYCVGFCLALVQIINIKTKHYNYRSKGNGQLPLNLGIDRKFGIYKIGRLRVNFCLSSTSMY